MVKRIIVNLSKGNPYSVNEGIRKEEFPTAMSSTTAWIRILWRCGRNCKFAKCDWASAYKQSWLWSLGLLVLDICSLGLEDQ